MRMSLTLSFLLETLGNQRFFFTNAITVTVVVNQFEQK